jgi:hypothetical protein
MGEGTRRVEMNSLSKKDAKDMVGPGWSKILDKLYGVKPQNVVVMQVEEKFGRLRFCVGSAEREFYDAIDAAEKESCLTCELCGKPGKLREDSGWLMTLCDEHYQYRGSK